MYFPMLLKPLVAIVAGPDFIQKLHKIPGNPVASFPTSLKAHH